MGEKSFPVDPHSGHVNNRIYYASLSAGLQTSGVHFLIQKKGRKGWAVIGEAVLCDRSKWISKYTIDWAK